MNLIKKILLGLLVLLFNQVNSQTFLSGVKNHISDKATFSKALKKVENTSERFFYKISPNFGYIFTGTYRDLDGDNKSYMDVSFSENNDTLTALVYTFQKSTKKFVLSATVHGGNHNKRTKYVRKKGDVYVALEDVNIPLNYTNSQLSLINFSYLLYNPQKGLYFHQFYYTETFRCQQATGQWHYDFSYGDWRQSTTPGMCVEYINGRALYQKKKEDELSSEELEITNDDIEEIVKKAYE